MIQQGLGTHTEMVRTNLHGSLISTATTKQENGGSLGLTAHISIRKTPENIRITLSHKLVQYPHRELERNDVSVLFLAIFTDQELTGWNGRDRGFPAFSAEIQAGTMSALMQLTAFEVQHLWQNPFKLT